MRIAIVGTGVSGLTTAWLLARRHEVHVFEADDRIGGHSNTVLCGPADAPIPVDTGFIVYNERTYPLFTSLLAQLNVATQPSTMSLSVRDEAADLEYNGTSLNGLFAQRSNLLRPGFYGMLRDLLRFNRLALANDAFPGSLHEFLRAFEVSERLTRHYIIPMTSAIWSAPRDAVLAMPMRFFVRFFANHGMLTVNNRPQWRTITGGSRSYVAALTAPFLSRIRTRTPVRSIRRGESAVTLTTDSGTESFDHAVIAAHSTDALALLADPSTAERSVFSAIPYQANEAVLHTDTRLLPRRRRAWAAWNAHVDASETPADAPTGVTYNLTILQNLPTTEQYLVTLNRAHAIDPRRIIRRIQYHHPVFSAQAVAAQSRHAEISGVRRTHYCGAYWGFGFHEDGVRSATVVARAFGERL